MFGLKFSSESKLFGGCHPSSRTTSATLDHGDINEDEDETNKIGAGAVEMKFFTTVNVTAVKLFGTATRGEKVHPL